MCSPDPLAAMQAYFKGQGGMRRREGEGGKGKGLLIREGKGKRAYF